MGLVELFARCWHAACCLPKCARRAPHQTLLHPSSCAWPAAAPARCAARFHAPARARGQQHAATAQPRCDLCEVQGRHSGQETVEGSVACQLLRHPVCCPCYILKAPKEWNGLRVTCIATRASGSASLPASAPCCSGHRGQRAQRGLLLPPQPGQGGCSQGARRLLTAAQGCLAPSGAGSLVRWLARLAACSYVGCAYRLPGRQIWAAAGASLSVGPPYQIAFTGRGCRAAEPAPLLVGGGGRLRAAV